MKLLHALRTAYRLMSHQEWVVKPDWKADDARNLITFLESSSGTKLKIILRDTVIMQQAAALRHKHTDLPYEAGYATGQAAIVAAITSFAQLTTDGEDSETDQPAN